MLLAKPPSQFKTRHIERRRKGIGLFSRWGDYRRGQNLLSGPAGARVDDVAVTLALVVEELRPGAAGAEGLVVEEEFGEADIRFERMTEGDGPAGENLGCVILGLGFGIRNGF